MPTKDGTGPNGQGSRTGRGMGNCAGQGGNSRPFGRGRGLGNRAVGSGPNTSQGNSWIQTQLNDLQAAIQRLTERLDAGKNE